MWPWLTMPVQIWVSYTGIVTDTAMKTLLTYQQQWTLYQLIVILTNKMFLDNNDDFGMNSSTFGFQLDSFCFQGNLSRTFRVMHSSSTNKSYNKWFELEVNFRLTRMSHDVNFKLGFGLCFIVTLIALIWPFVWNIGSYMYMCVRRWNV